MESKEEIDVQIAALEHQILELRSRRNATVGLCRLPSELVVRIIKNVYPRPTEGVKNDAPHTRELSPSFVLSRDEIISRVAALTRIMRVCHRLREVALDARELWSLFALKYGTDQRRLEAQLELAGGAPLTIWAGDVKANRSSLDGWIASRLGNTKSACLTLEKDMRMLAATLATPKPLLRQLEVDFTSSRGFSIGSTFLGGCCENLTHLSLLAAVINVPPSLPSLLCLRIQNLGGDGWLKVLAALLHKAPRLEELSVAQTHKPASPNEVDDDIQQACLPFLREVDVRIYDATALHDILRLIPPPQQHFSATRLSLDDSPGVSSEEIYPLLKPFWPATASPTGTLTLYPSSEWRHRGLTVGKITLECESDSLPRSGPAFSFDIEHLYEDEVGPSYWPHVHTLRLPAHSADQVVRENGSSWYEVERLSSIRTLVLFGTFAETDKRNKWKDLLSWLGRRAIAGNTIDTIMYPGSIVVNHGISETLRVTPADLANFMLGLVRHRVTAANNKKIPVVKRAVWRQQGMADRIWTS
jgi:hypothetical protein